MEFIFADLIIWFQSDEWLKGNAMKMSQENRSMMTTQPDAIHRFPVRPVSLHEKEPLIVGQEKAE